MQLQGVVGPQTVQSLGGGTVANVRQGNMGELIKSDLHAPFYEGSYRGTRFGAANQAAVATTAAFATTYTGLVLYNQNGSAVNLVLEKVGVTPILAQTTTVAVGLMVGQSTTAFSGVTAVTPRSKKIGSGYTPVGLVASAATLPVAPTLDTLLGYIGTGATTVDQLIPTMALLGGDIILPPGAFVAVYTNAATVASSLFLSFQWEEVPV
jgi:hypothetical protein